MPKGRAAVGRRGARRRYRGRIGALGAYESIWHTDISYNPEPPSASALYALEAPPAGERPAVSGHQK